MCKEMVLKNGELSTPEIRKLIRAHNVLVSIKIPVGASRDKIFKILDDKGYRVNHVQKSIQRQYKSERKPNVTLAQADKVLKKPDKTLLQKQKLQEKKEATKEVQKKKEREIKKEAVKKALQVKPKPAPKPKPPPKPKSKKEDDVRPKEKVGKPKFDPKKVQYTVKGQLQIADKKKGQIVKKPVKVSLKDKLIEKDKKSKADIKKVVKQRKEDKKPYKPSANEGSLKDKILKLTDYFVEDKNKIGKTFKTIRDVNKSIAEVFGSVGGTKEDPFSDLDISERKYLIKLMNSMLRYSTKDPTGVEVTKQSLKKYKGWFSETSVKDGTKKVRTEEKAPEVLKKKLLKPGSQLEDKPAIRARELDEAKKAKAKKEAKKAKAKKGSPKEDIEEIPFEEESSYSNSLKAAMKKLYGLINDAIKRLSTTAPEDLVEIKQESEFLKTISSKYDDLTETLDDDEDIDILIEEWDDKLEPELEKIVKEQRDKNRIAINWKPEKPDLKKLQAQYKKFNDAFKKNNKPTDFQAAKRAKDQIVKFYKEADVPK